MDVRSQPIATQPDNVFVVLLVFLLAIFLWLAFRRMAVNDRRRRRGEPPAEGRRDEQVMVWPDLLYIELIFMLICTAALIVAAVLIPAPLEAPADPNITPNPAKAPWYFVGLQELLVYFDPWFAGVILPTLIVVGLCSIPFLDRNPRGNGYYTFRQRPVAITVFLLGFLVLWILPIIVGVFFRGPNWAFYGPFEPWDPQRCAAASEINLSDLLWSRLFRTAPAALDAAGRGHYYLHRELPGLAALAAYFVMTPLLLRFTCARNLYTQMGRVRWAIMMFLLLCMLLVPIKMLLRWLFDVKYIVALTEWSFNL